MIRSNFLSLLPIQTIIKALVGLKGDIDEAFFRSYTNSSSYFYVYIANVGDFNIDFINIKRTNIVFFR